MLLLVFVFEYEDKMPADQADDMQWSMLDPIHVRHFNEQLSKKDDTDLIVCEYTYLERRHSNVNDIFLMFFLCVRGFRCTFENRCSLSYGLFRCFFKYEAYTIKISGFCSKFKMF